MHKDTQTFCQTCDICQRAKTSTQSPYGLLHPLIIPQHPFTHISVDFMYIGETDFKGKKVDSLCVIADRFSSRIVLIPISKELTAMEFAELFFEFWVKDFGIPEDMVTDRDRLFTSNFWTALCKLMGINRTLSTAYYLQTDGNTERINKEIKQTMTALQLQYLNQI